MKIKRGALLVLVYFIALFQGRAQICSGSLGDPVVNITFGAGNNPGSSLSAQLPNLSYTSSGCPDDGFYTIVNSTSGCFNNTWHSVSEDHTTDDANGYMMLINASFSSGIFYVDTVKGLCGGTTYEFAAWALNMLRPGACGPGAISPNLTFNIESTTGTILGTIQTGTILQSSGPEWHQFGLFFTTPPTASNVVLRLANNAPGGCGNDLILDDITFRPCGPSVKTAIVGTLATSVDKCVDDLNPIPLKATVSTGYNNPSYQWQRSKDASAYSDIPGETNLFYTHLPSGSGLFKYRLTIAEKGNIGAANCRIASNEITVTVHDPPGKGAGSNSPVCTNDSIRLHGGIGAIFNWQGPNNFSTTQKDPVIKASFAAAGKYYVQIADQFGCKGSDSLSVVVNQSPVAQSVNSVNVCEDFPVMLTASGGASYQWLPLTGLSSPTISNPIATLSDSIVYTIVVSTALGCTDTTKTVVNVWKKPTANAGPDKVIFEGQPVILNGAAGGDNTNFEWSPASSIDNSHVITPTVRPAENTIYTLTVSSGFGCVSAEDEVFVRVFKKLTIPNAFSPNGDGINDVWRINNLVTYPEADLTVFDRYGKIVFHSKGYNKEWDGTRNNKPLPVGTYYYIIDLKNNLPLVNGSVFIIR